MKLWDTENPNLYVAKLQLRNPEGKTVQEREYRVGFRTVEFFPQDGLYLNGVKLVVKGINRHSFSVDGGRATSAAMSRQDAMLIKEMNMNAVRSHYPPDEHFLDMCDSLGLVYIDELAGWQDAYDSKVGAKLVREMVRRDVNHPSIILWCNGNEGGWNYDTDKLFAKYDKFQKRHVIHPWADFDDLDTHHYPAYLTGVARFTNGYKVFMPTEFMHAMYDQGGGAGLRDFWDRWMTSPLFAGGFVWVFCDEAPKRTDKGGILDSDQSNAPDGVVGPRREKEGSYYAIRAQWSPIQLKPLMITSHFDGSFMVSNEYTYTNLKDCRMTYRVLKCNTPMQNNLPEPVELVEGGFDDAFMDTEVYNLGLTFSYPEAECKGMRWMGRGPYRVWKNRVPGTNYGIWQKDYNNTITGETFENLIYPEFKGYHANMYWATLESDKAPFTVYSRNDGIFYRIFTPEEPVGSKKRTMPVFPEGDISFLLDIPAIASFKPVKQQGPNSQPGNIRIKKGDEGLHIDLMFDFRQNKQ